MKMIEFEEVNTLYTVDVDEYRAAAVEGAEEYHFKLDGREVPVNGSNE